MRPIIAAALSLALAACQPQAPDGAPAPAPADAPAPAAAQTPSALSAALQGDLDAVGTEPFWSLSVRAGELTLTRPDQPEVKAEATLAHVSAGRAVWTAEVGGAPFVVTIWEAACSDGMSDRSFPLSAEVTLGGTNLKGCAAKAGAAPPQK